MNSYQYYCHSNRTSPFPISYGTEFSAIPPMVNQAKQVALNPRDNSAANRWRDVSFLVSLVNEFSGFR